MSDLVLRTAVGNYGHTTPLKDGTITSSAFSMEHIEVSPVTSIFRRMVRELEFDVAEMALSTYLCARAHGKQFTGVPVFLTRAFYHGGIVVNRKSGIESPKDLEGKRFGVRSYTLTPGVWTRGLLQTEYGVDLDAVTWVLSGDEHVAEYVAPANVVSSSNGNLGEMLLSGEIDAAIGAGPGGLAGHPAAVRGAERCRRRLAPQDGGVSHQPHAGGQERRAGRQPRPGRRNCSRRSTRPRRCTWASCVRVMRRRRRTGPTTEWLT